jgi:hypothetical protein
MIVVSLACYGSLLLLTRIGRDVVSEPRRPAAATPRAGR